MSRKIFSIFDRVFDGRNRKGAYWEDRYHLGFRAKGREVIGGSERYQLRERSAGYEAFFGG